MIHDTENEITKEKYITWKTYWKVIIIKNQFYTLKLPIEKSKKNCQEFKMRKKETEVKIEVKMKERKPKIF